MAIGLPVIAGKASGGVPWVLDDGKAGFLTNVRDPKEIFKTLLTCIEQGMIRQEKQRNARDRVSNFFAPNSIAEQYEQMYEKVLSSHLGWSEVRTGYYPMRKKLPGLVSEQRKSSSCLR
jgi:glycosyltransferase involved in cell wall biosynthesis